MKLIEKLADDHYKKYVGDNPTIAAVIVEKLAKEFYVAGMCKMREMAAKFADSQLPDEYAGLLEPEILKIGEEEV